MASEFNLFFSLLTLISPYSFSVLAVHPCACSIKQRPFAKLSEISVFLSVKRPLARSSILSMNSYLLTSFLPIGLTNLIQKSIQSCLGAHWKFIRAFILKKRGQLIQWFIFVFFIWMPKAIRIDPQISLCLSFNRLLFFMKKSRGIPISLASLAIIAI